jgi:HNH endonuclease/AP2 domain
MKRNILTQEFLKEMLDYDPLTGIFTWKVSLQNKVKIGQVAGYIRKDGYRFITVNGTKYRAHRLAWFYVYGVWPTKDLDHRYGIRDDNRISELREATKSQNAANTSKHKDNTSGFKGVCWDKQAKKWKARIMINGKNKTLGLFDIIEEAALAVNKAALELYNDFACLNEVSMV